MDRRQVLDLLSMYDDRAAPFVARVPGDERFTSFHVVEPHGATYSKGAAVVATLRLLDRTRYLGRALNGLRLTWLVNGLYWVIARSRGLLGHLVADAPGPSRLRD